MGATEFLIEHTPIFFASSVARRNEKIENTLEYRVFTEQGFAVAEESCEGKLTTPAPELGCMDDRYTEAIYKTPGGVLFVAAMQTGGDERGIKMAADRVSKYGLTPVMHGDAQHGDNGCKFGELWADNKLNVPYELKVTRFTASGIVARSGGRYDILSGGHNADRLIINTRPNITTVPGYLAVDTDIMKQFAGGKYRQSLGALAQTVQALGISKVGIIP